MYHYLGTTNKAPFIDTKADFTYWFRPYDINLQPNIKVTSLEEFERKLFEDIIRGQEIIPDDEHDENSDCYKYSLHHLGNKKFKQELKRLFCTPIMGQYKNVYIHLRPHYTSVGKNYAHVKFDHVPSLVELMYAHSQIWQNFYRTETDINIDQMDHHYSVLSLSGNNYDLIFDPCMNL